jgi:hypothetical protein
MLVANRPIICTTNASDFITRVSYMAVGIPDNYILEEY